MKTAQEANDRCAVAHLPRFVCPSAICRLRVPDWVRAPIPGIHNVADGMLLPAASGG
jgi:hypothetical protein